jgi:hypothetical protein
MIAALFVQTGGAYYGIPGVDPWDEARDARRYSGPAPVVAHPPCSRWCQMAPVNHARYGQPIGDDGGCFEAALRSVHSFGGVLEHPAYSIAWERFGLPRPVRGAWVYRDGAYTTEVSQVAYGHAARKRTWLLYVGHKPPPSLDWSEPQATAHVSYCKRSGDGRPVKAVGKALSKQRASASPPAFRDTLMDLAWGAR